MTYSVKRIGPGRWALLSPFGDQMGLFPTRKEAKAIGSALAGWRGKVVVL